MTRIECDSIRDARWVRSVAREARMLATLAIVDGRSEVYVQAPIDEVRGEFSAAQRASLGLVFSTIETSGAV